MGALLSIIKKAMILLTLKAMFINDISNKYLITTKSIYQRNQR